MAKRHQFGIDFASRVQRMQELIMAHSGIDEFYEIVRLILAKFYAEKVGLAQLPDREKCDALLKQNQKQIGYILDNNIKVQSPPEIFDEIRSVFGEINLSKQDFTALDHAFEVLTSRTYKSDKGQYFTPRHVVDMCVEAIDPKPDELVCDPACGSAAFLKSVHSYSKSKYGKASSLYGFDYSHRASQVAKLVSLIGADGDITVNQIDSLRLPGQSLIDGERPTIEALMGNDFSGFDAIITNPPFAGDVSLELFSTNYEVAAFFSRRLERDVLFIERCISLLKDGGRLAIVLPDNKVSSKNFGALRLWLARNAEIKAVVSLHRYTFLPYTSQKAAVLFAVKREKKPKPYYTDVHFYRSDKPGKTSNGSFQYRKNADPNLPPYQSLEHDLSEIAGELRGHLCAK